MITPDDVVRGCLELGLDGVGVTEHSPSEYGTLAPAFEAAGLLLVPGREVFFGPHHVLVFSADPHLLEDLPVRADPEDLAHPGTALVWAHPAFPGGSNIHHFLPPGWEEIGGVVHAVEVLNGRRLHLAWGVSAAAEAGEVLGLSGTGGSDAHRPAEVGRCFTEVGADDRDPSAVVEAIRRGRVRPVLSRAWAERHGYDYRDDLAAFLG